MSKRPRRMSTAQVALGVLVLVAGHATGAVAQAGAPRARIDPVAVEILRKTAEYVGSLKQFSISARYVREDLTASGHRVDFEKRGGLVVRRPDKLRAYRGDTKVEQVMYYDGRNITLHNTAENVYATRAAPGGFDRMFPVALDSLDLVIPMSDLLWPNAFSLLMQNVTSATVIDREVISNVSCTHLLFTRRDVDFQIWVADTGPPLPYKYIVTDIGSPALLSGTNIIDHWKIESNLPDRMFTFVPGNGAQAVTFLPAPEE